MQARERYPATFGPHCWTVLLLAAAALLAFIRLDIPLQEPQEVRYAEIPRQMLADGNWLVPVLHGEPYLDKPPLLYWLVMASYSVFGIHDWAARLVPSTCVFLTVFMTYFWGRRILGLRGGFLAAMILLLSVRYLYLARMLTMDTLLCLFIVAALASAHSALGQPAFRWRPWLLSAVACGLGLLAKGPVALVLVVVPIFVFPFLDRRAARPHWSAWLSYGGVAFGVAAPWFLAMIHADPAFAEYFFWKHNVERFATPFDHQEPMWFYVPGLVLGMLPWTLLLPGLARSFLGQAEPTPDRPSPQRFFLPAFFWCLFFFSLAGCKRPGYMLPAVPLVALVLGCYLDTLLPRDVLLGSLLRYRSRMAFAAMVLTLALGVGGILFAVQTQLVKPSIGLATALLGLGALALLAFRRRTYSPSVSWLHTGGVAFLLLVLGMCQALPSYARRFSLRGQVRCHGNLCSDGDLPVACYPRRWDSISFYLSRDDVRAYTTDDRQRLIADLVGARKTLLFVKSNRALQEVLSDLPSTLEFAPLGRQGGLAVGVVRARNSAN